MITEDMEITLVKTALGEFLPEQDFGMAVTLAIVLASVFAASLIGVVIYKAVKKND